MKNTADIICADPLQPETEIINRAADIIRQGKVVVLPTRGLYGLAVDALNHRAVARVFDIKGRDTEKPLPVLIDHINMMKRIALPVNAMARYLMDEFWPGKITFVVFARPELPYGLTASSNKVGIRLVAHPVARDLIRVVDKPLTGTSANISGTGGCASVEELDDALKRRVDLIIDAGILKGGPGSTVVDVSGARPEILRPGAIAVDSVWQAYRRHTAKNIDNPD